MTLALLPGSLEPLRLKYAKIAANIDATITACHYTEDLKLRFEQENTAVHFMKQALASFEGNDSSL